MSWLMLLNTTQIQRVRRIRTSALTVVRYGWRRQAILGKVINVSR